MTKPDSQSEVIAFLSEPTAYGVNEPIERIDTHAAIIFLVGDRAYKLKRAVRYPYLDFSTAPKRKAICQAELILNRRTAPDLYLEVRFIGRTNNGSLAFGEGSPIDWLVVMRRFAAEGLWDVMAREGRLVPRLLRDLADEVARFHGIADIVRDHDAVGRVRSVIKGNRVSMAELPDTALASSECARLCKASLVLLDQLSPLLARRGGAGLVRHCHGDLHLGNICMWRGKPILFDCLEFDADLATSDLLYDLAFLLMDLWQRGLHGEASLVFNRYCDRRAETEGLAAMPLFLSMRAAVRAHVEARAADRQPGAKARKDKLVTARRYLTSGLCFLDRPQPRLLAVGGLSGSGKSTLAARLAPLIGTPPGARLLRTDMLRKRLAGVDPEAHLPESAYTQETHDAVYAALLDEARKTLNAGWPVIVDAVFDFPAARAQVEALAREVSVPFAGLWLNAPRDLLQARVRARRGDASDAGPTVVDKQLRRDIGILEGWRSVDARGDAQKTLERAIAALGPEWCFS